MSQIEHVPTTYRDAVETLAAWHGEAGADDLRIYAAKDIDDDVVRLIHVSDELPTFVPLRPYVLGPSAQFPFGSAVILLKPDQWKKIKLGIGDLRLPSDWNVDNAVQVWPISKGAVLR